MVHCKHDMQDCEAARVFMNQRYKTWVDAGEMIHVEGEPDKDFTDWTEEEIRSETERRGLRNISDLFWKSDEDKAREELELRMWSLSVDDPDRIAYFAKKRRDIKRLLWKLRVFRIRLKIKNQIAKWFHGFRA